MFKSNPLSLFIITVIFCLFVGCNVINPAEGIPSYIHIDKIDVTTTSDQGSNSSKITDAWVYVDDQLIGAFELPATFPLLWSGKHTVSIRPGIKVNGISAARAIYPFYTNYTAIVNLVPDSVITINPTLTYNSYTVFEWKESFEDGGVSLEKTLFSDTTLDKTSDPLKVFEGDYSGVVHLDAAHPYFQCKTINNFVLPTGDAPVFLEMNYKTNNLVKIGLIGNSSSQIQMQDVLYLNRTDTWKKIYINLKNAVNTATGALDFNVNIEIQKESDVANPEILFDNFKLVHN